MCDIWKRTTSQEMHRDDLDRHRSSLQALGVKHVVFTGGEPLMHTDFPALCRFFQEMGIRLTLLTAGLLLSRHARDVAASFDDVIVSLDGPATIHDQIRRVKNASLLLQQGVSAVRDYRPEMHISCRTTVQKLNHIHLEATVLTAKQYGLDGISFLPADLSSQAFNREKPWDEERQDGIGLALEEVIALEYKIESMIRSCIQDIRSGYIAESPSKLRRISSRFREHLGLAHPSAPLCNAPWVSAVVDTDGSVRPCFFHNPIGNMNNQTLEEVLNGASAMDFRDNLDIATNPICQRCVCSLNYRPE